MIIRVIVLISIILTFSGCGNYSNETISANDNGMGKGIKLYVKPDANGTSILKDANNNIALKWTDTGLIVSSFLTEIQTQSIRVGLSINGRWYPFGNSGDNKECVFVNCDPAIDIRCNNLSSDIQIVDPNHNQGCSLSSGKGIYMLIAKQTNGSAPDPNMNVTVANSPSSVDGFYTAHLGDFTVDKDGLIIIDKMWECDNSTSMISCTSVPLSQLVGGKIYLKIYDGYYGDNSADLTNDTGSYVFVNIQTGVVYPNFVSEAITIIVTTIDSASYALNQSLVGSLKNLAFCSILLYIALTGFMFMIGLSKITQKEAVMRLLKISIVLMFLTPNNIIAEEFPKLYQVLANFSSNIIINNMNASAPVTEQDKSISQLENSLNYLKFYDSIINQILSRQVNLKLIALLFTINFWLLPFMYILIVIIVYVVLQSMLLYITAYMQIAILIVLLPILVPALLFETTSDLFQHWLKYMANSALMIVVATTGLGIVLSIMISDFSGLISYSVTKSWWWFPDNNDAVSKVLNFKTYMSTFMKTLICYSFVEIAPKLADALSDSQMSPSSQAFSSLSHSVNGMISNGINRLKSINNKYLVGRLMDQAYKTNGKYDANKEKTGLLNKLRQTRQNISSIGSMYKKNQVTKFVIDDLIRPIYTNERELAHEKEQENSMYNKNQQRANKYTEVIKTRETEYQKAINDNLNSIQTVNIDGTQHDLSQDGKSITHNGVEIAKQDIREAIAKRENSIQNFNIQPIAGPGAQAYNAHDNYKHLKETLEKLQDLKKDLER